MDGEPNLNLCLFDFGKFTVLIRSWRMTVRLGTLEFRGQLSLGPEVVYLRFNLKSLEL